MARNRQTTIPISQQILFAVYFCAAAIVAIYLRGDPILLSALIVCTPIALLLSWIPLKIFPGWLRQIVQLIISAFAIYGAYLNIQEYQPDLVLVQMTSIFGLALLLTRRRGEYSLLFMISTAFLVYGGLVPSRPAFLPIFMSTTALAVAILYSTRQSILLGKRSPMRAEALSKPPRRRTVRFVLAHLFFVIITMILLFKFSPQTQSFSTFGYFPTSFATGQDLLFPQLWEKWQKPLTDLFGDSDNPGQTDKTPENETENKTADLSPEAQQIVNASNTKSMDSHAGGGNASTIGTALLFQVRSPAKLYWTVQLYDTYDGNEWKTSEILDNAWNRLDTYTPKNVVVVPQMFITETPNSLKLPYAFRYRIVRWLSRKPPEINSIFDKEKPFSIRVVPQMLSEAPWVFAVRSDVPQVTENDQTAIYWNESHFRGGWVYRHLPSEIISNRLRALAKNITRFKHTPYEKALAIQNFLRNNYTYDLETPPIPDNMETVDYFLFESRRGYCQHFAQAFTVLARLAGLQSRLATGYSPGHFNLITNVFEVYEYHAHAWSQVFCAPYGWLTFDGTPPGEIHIDNTPSTIAYFSEPFSDSWSAKPPELSVKPPQIQQRKPGQHSDHKLMWRVTERAVEMSKGKQPNASAIAVAFLETLAKDIASWFKTRAFAFKSAFQAFWQTLSNSFRNLIFDLRTMSIPGKCLLGLLLLSVITAIVCRKRLAKTIRRCGQKYSINRKFRQLNAADALPPDQLVIQCHSLVCDVLAFHSITRSPSQDLIEWSDSLQETLPGCAPDFKILSQTAAQALYAPLPITHETASRILVLTKSIMEKLSNISNKQEIQKPSATDH